MEANMERKKTFLTYLEKSVLDNYIAKTGSTIKIFEHYDYTIRFNFIKEIQKNALLKGMYIVDLDVEKIMGLGKWKNITEYMMKNMAFYNQSGKSSSFYEIVLSWRKVFDEEKKSEFKGMTFSSPGIKDAVLYILNAEDEWSIPPSVKRLLLGEKVTQKEFNGEGVYGIRGSLTEKNSQSILRTLTELVGLFNSAGIAIFINDKNNQILSNSRHTQRAIQSAIFLRNLIDGTVSGVLASTIIYLGVEPGFVSECSIQYPALGQRLQLTADKYNEAVWNSVLIPIEHIDFPNNPTRLRQMKKSIMDQAIDSRKSLEAMRFGLVPEKNSVEMSVGVEPLFKWLENCALDIEFQPSVYQIIGSYGSGKSHSLELTKQFFKNKNYLVCNIEINQKGVSFSNMNSILREMMLKISQIFAAKDDYPLVYLFEKASQNPNSSILKNKEGKVSSLLRLLEKHPEITSNENTLDLLERVISCDESVNNTLLKKALKDHRENIVCFMERKLEDRIANFWDIILDVSQCVQLAGYEGLILLVDEFEVEHANLLELYKVEESFYYLEDIINKVIDYPEESRLGLFFATVNIDSGQGDPILSKLFKNSDDHCYEIKEFDEFTELAEKISSLYSMSYGIEYTFDSELAQRLNVLLKNKLSHESGLIRAYIKWYMGLLDKKYGPVSNTDPHK